MHVDLSDPFQLPDAYMQRLRALDDLCRNIEYSDELFDDSSAFALVQDLNDYCMQHRIIGIHYTRADPQSIRSQGLLNRSGAQIRNEFLNAHADKFTANEIEAIKNRWAAYFSYHQTAARDNRIFFNFTEQALKNGGAEPLLTLYGGEQVSMCFDRDEAIGRKLCDIGTPLVIRCSLDPAKLKTYIEYPYGKVLVSAYHCRINPESIQVDQDAFQEEPIMLRDILNIKVESMYAK